MRTFLLLAAASVHLLSPVTAADREAEAQKRKQLLELATEKQKAMIVSFPGKDLHEPAMVFVGLGCFIDADGMAVMSLTPFMDANEHGFVCGEKQLKKPKLLYVDAAHMIAVAKFDHQPEVWIQPRVEALESRKDWAAMLTSDGVSPALVGPVWGRWKMYNVEAREMVLCDEVQLLTGFPVGPLVIGEGSPVIDDQGRLCGVFRSFRPNDPGRGVNVSPSDAWTHTIDKARKAKEGIAYPLKDDDSPKGPANINPAYRTAMNAVNAQQFELGMAELDKAFKERPDSMLLKRARAIILQAALQSGHMQDRRKDLVPFCEALNPGLDAKAQMRAVYLQQLGMGHRVSGDIEKATDCFVRAAALALGDIPTLQYELSRIHYEAGRLDEAIAAMRKAAKTDPGSLFLLTPLSQMLGEAARWEEEDKITEDIYEIERLTQPVSR